ncbi:antitoxin, Phd family protein [Erythrobacter longus]|uniref:Antitoxin n=1 Tax=Erythrobacter longus TaxID=1044 RepID=A0A074M6R9_ERYLO|nr:type II toxin-antitoxin system Phd/YefM family antitoxin [Erythrobacter longus]KEO90461.1 antitoxin, Phd family protein [Erythrobacter longus]
MKIEDRVKPISYLKAHSAEIIRELSDGGAPLVITQNGEAKAVLQDIGSFEQAQETLALLKLLAMGQADLAAGRIVPVEGLADRIRQSVD